MLPYELTLSIESLILVEFNLLLLTRFVKFGFVSQ